MKTRVKLLMFVLVVVAALLCVAACNGGGGEVTDAPTTTAPTTTTEAPVTTTEAPVTTPAPVTTTAPVTTDPGTTPTPPPATGTVHEHAANAELVATGTTYTGKALTNKGYALRGANTSAGKIRVAYSFQKLDPTTLAPVGEASSTAPVDAGTYKITATFSWGVAATDDDKAYTLPEPLTATWEVAPMEITTVNFGAKDYETFYYDSLALDVAAANSVVTSGTPIAGLVRSFAVAKVDNADGDNPVSQVGTVIAAAGYYKVTITYVEETGKENFANEDTLSHDAIVYIRDLSAAEYQVKKAEGVLIDGVIDDAYLNSATITSAYQTPGYDDPTAGIAVVNPYENIGMTKISNPGSIAVPDDTEVTLYVLWGEEAGAPYLYVIVDVVDSTYNPRSTKYTNVRNAWINDSVEFSYKLGGYSVPVLPDGQDTYPTYSTVLADAREKAAADHGVNGTMNHTAVDAQKSLFFDNIQSATARTDDGYTIELKIPARSESFEGRPGYDDFARTEGANLTAGEYVFLCLQLNDLTGVPAGYASYEEYDAQIDTFTVPKYENEWKTNPQGEWIEFESVASQFVYSSGNRNAAYLRTPGAGPAVFQLSDEWAD